MSLITAIRVLVNTSNSFFSMQCQKKKDKKSHLLLTVNAQCSTWAFFSYYLLMSLCCRCMSRMVMYMRVCVLVPPCATDSVFVSRPISTWPFVPCSSAALKAVVIVLIVSRQFASAFVVPSCYHLGNRYQSTEDLNLCKQWCYWVEECSKCCVNIWFLTDMQYLPSAWCQLTSASCI